MLGIFIVGGFALFGALGHQLVQRKLGGHAGGHNELAGRLIGVLIGMYGIMLAFIIVSLYQEFNATEANVRTEATELSQLLRDSKAFPTDVQDDLHGVIGDYIRTVIDEEWDLMADGRFSQRAWDDVQDLYVIYQSYSPEGAPANAFYDESVTKLNDLVGARRERLEHAERSLPRELLVLLLAGAFFVVAFMSFFGSSTSWVQTAMVGAVGALVGFNMLLVVTLDHPFSGDVTVSNHVFTEGALAEFVAPHSG
ncbi:MAG: hypothetical protein QOG04_1633 [Actinomycetota bacterium]|jgi:hypothetical protein|nr:hypothetical protein [Actinomycetota bacterium]